VEKVYKWGHFGASGLRGLRRFEHKGCVGEPKEIDPKFYLSLSFSNINKILQTL
jgi:hypothetical protein